MKNNIEGMVCTPPWLHTLTFSISDCYVCMGLCLGVHDIVGEHGYVEQLHGYDDYASMVTT